MGPLPVVSSRVGWDSKGKELEQIESKSSSQGGKGGRMRGGFMRLNGFGQRKLDCIDGGGHVQGDYAHAFHSQRHQSKGEGILPTCNQEKKGLTLRQRDC